MAMVEGSCLCGAVSYEMHGDFDGFFLCHCRHCRKDTGSAHAANLFSRNATLVWRSGESGISSYTLPGTRHGRSFCAKCGSALPHVQTNLALTVVPAGSLDGPAPIPPSAHLFCGSRADWDNELEQVFRFDGLPE